ncbi:Transcriptional regulators of sugar metabolism [Ruminococcus sp. SR1/5]|nr:Transcriptional regulators of sugar metabolism [Ruminococcus sp. SR1/5]
MINSGKMRILVVDSTKFDQTAFSVAGQLRDIETIITDKKPSEKWLDHFNRHKIECIYPK